MLTESERKQMVERICSGMGHVLRQDYVRHNGEWWLFTGGEPMRALRPDEVDWHVLRNHAPFVEGGIEKGDPHWWDEPKVQACEGSCVVVMAWCPDCDCVRRHIHVSEDCIECTECGELTELSRENA